MVKHPDVKAVTNGFYIVKSADGFEEVLKAWDRFYDPTTIHMKERRPSKYPVLVCVEFVNDGSRFLIEKHIDLGDLKKAMEV